MVGLRLAVIRPTGRCWSFARKLMPADSPLEVGPAAVVGNRQTVVDSAWAEQLCRYDDLASLTKRLCCRLSVHTHVASHHQPGSRAHPFGSREPLLLPGSPRRRRDAKRSIRFPIARSAHSCGGDSLQLILRRRLYVCL